MRNISFAVSQRKGPLSRKRGAERQWALASAVAASANGAFRLHRFPSQHLQLQPPGSRRGTYRRRTSHLHVPGQL